MPSFNFKPQFVDDVENYIKLQTIRSTKRGNVGDTAYLYTGMRTKNCRKLGEGILTFVDKFQTDGKRVLIGDSALLLSPDSLDKFARADGFSDFSEMVEWFSKQYGLPYCGYLHQWKPKEKEK